MRNRIAAATLGAAIATFGAAPGTVIAQDDATPPRPIAQPMPEPATSSFGFPIEGWVKIRYSVLADGTTADVRAVDSMPPQIPVDTAIEAVESWTFEPATVGGSPSDWYNNVAVIVHDNEQIPNEASQPFIRSYLQIQQEVTEEDFKKALSERNVMVGRAVNRLNEIGLIEMLTASIHFRLEDPYSAWESIERATLPEADQLTGTDLETALYYRYIAAMQLGYAHAAIDSFKSLEAIGSSYVTPQISSQARAVEERLNDGETALQIKGRAGKEPWAHTPSRRTFAFADVDGSIDEIEVECNRKKTVLEYEEDVEWSLPESWGACTLFVDAKRDTTFSLYEFP